MRWTVLWSSRAKSDLDALDRQVKRRVLAAIHLLAESNQGNVIRLHGTREPKWRLRVGDWRVILVFDYPQHTFTVERALHRGEAYRGL